MICIFFSDSSNLLIRQSYSLRELKITIIIIIIIIIQQQEKSSKRQSVRPFAQHKHQISTNVITSSTVEIKSQSKAKANMGEL